MTRSILIGCIIIIAILCFGIIYQKYTQPNSEIFLQEREKLLEEEPEIKAELPALVKEINVRNASIKSLSCERLDIKIWQNGHRFQLSGKIYSEKPINFRMTIDSIMGHEVDIGSNDKNFWYWSRRDKVPGLHYAAHPDLYKSRLKTPFNPIFLRSTLGIEELPNENFKIVENEKHIMVTYPQINASGEDVLFSVFINKDKKQIDGYLIVNKDGKTAASCEIQEYSVDIPTKILYNWNEEERIMLITLTKPQFNQTLSSQVWEMPPVRPKLDMAKD